MEERVIVKITGFIGLLTILFIVLKLFGVINWSWLWVLTPIWIPFVILIVAVWYFSSLSDSSIFD